MRRGRPTLPRATRGFPTEKAPVRRGAGADLETTAWVARAATQGRADRAWAVRGARGADALLDVSLPFISGEPSEDVKRFFFLVVGLLVPLAQRPRAGLSRQIFEFTKRGDTSACCVLATIALVGGSAGGLERVVSKCKRSLAFADLAFCPSCCADEGVSGGDLV